jgi:hypothetical protein
MSIPQYLPKVAVMLMDFTHLSKEFGKKVRVDKDLVKENEQFVAFNKEEMREMKFNINHQTAEIEYVKKCFSPETLSQINKSRERIKYIEG